MENRVIAILGTTASGKSEVGRGLAARVGGEIVSVDSMKVYRGMDIGTAKPRMDQPESADTKDRPEAGPPEDRPEAGPPRARPESGPTRDRPEAGPPLPVPIGQYHLIDVVDPWESFSAARFVALADAAIDAIHARGRPAVAVGGTMLYFRCLYEGLFDAPSADPAVRDAIRRRVAVEGLDALHAELAAVDPAAAARIHRNDLRRIERALEVYTLTRRPISEQQAEWDAAGPGLEVRQRRPDWRWTLIGLRRPREEESRRINARVQRMMQQGLLDEVRRLWGDPRDLSEQARRAVGYAELIEHLQGGCELERAVERIKINTRRSAKHQRTWLRRFAAVKWIDVGPYDEPEALVERIVTLPEDGVTSS